MGAFQTAQRLTADATEEIRTTTTGGGGAINVNLQQVAGAPPALNNALPVELSDGTNAFGTPGNPLNVQVTGGSGTGTIGAAVPLTGSYQAVNVGGTLRGQTGVNVTGAVFAAQMDKTSVGGVGLQAASGANTDGTGVNEIVRTISRRFGLQFTAVVPTISVSTYYPGAVTSPTASNWIDTNQTGADYVEVTVVITGAGTIGSIFIENADDANDTTSASNTNSQLVTAANLGVGTTTIAAIITRRYWRVKWTNTATAAATFKLYYTEQVIAPSGAVNPATGYQPLDGTAISDGVSPAAGPLGISMFAAGGIRTGPGTALQFLATSSAPSGPFVYERTPNIFKTATATASGNTALWTPTAGKKFRLMRLIVMITENATLGAAAVLTVSFQDSASALNIAFDIFVPNAAGATIGDGYSSGWIDFGNGILSAAANNVLNTNLSAAVTAGNVRVIACGTEE